MNILEISPEQSCSISANLKEYGDMAETMNWISSDRSLAAEAERARLLADLESSAEFELECNRTKPHIGPLSPGCRICSQGSWSCLFVNGKCNCQCFYCPSPQAEIGVPTTNRIPFSRPADYAAYIDLLEFRGASISGGEPLMTPDRAIRFIEAVRRRKGKRVHLWMYTNGTLLNKERVTALAEAGLEEIRFDLTAVDYDLKKIALAAGGIPCVTVEIPAIPEDKDRLGRMLPDLKAAGVDHLNLHQLRMTPYNSTRLLSRGYTLLHGEKVTVLESELAALSLMRDACQKGIGLPINYCSFVYKHRYQSMAVRRRLAPWIKKDYEGTTGNGYIRTLSLTGPSSLLEKQASMFFQAGADSRRWQMTGKKDRLFFHDAFWPMVDKTSFDVTVSYAKAVLRTHTSYRYPFKKIPLTTKTGLVVEKQTVHSSKHIPAQQLDGLDAFLPVQVACGDESIKKLPVEFEAFEFIRPGLQDYY